MTTSTSRNTTGRRALSGSARRISSSAQTIAIARKAPGRAGAWKCAKSAAAATASAAIATTVNTQVVARFIVPLSPARPCDRRPPSKRRDYFRRPVETPAFPPGGLTPPRCEFPRGEPRRAPLEQLYPREAPACRSNRPTPRAPADAPARDRLLARARNARDRRLALRRRSRSPSARPGRAATESCASRPKRAFPTIGRSKRRACRSTSAARAC